MKIPEALNATYIMLSETFPDGMSEEHYWVVLYLLYDYMCDENLSLILSIFANKDFGVVMNDVYRVGEKGFEVDSK